MILIRHHKY